jgi:signal transduction histidine kinase
MAFGGVALIAVLVIRDLSAANAEARQMYSGTVHGLQRIGELQYFAQETRRATLYALTTEDSNLQVEYADQSRDADQRVKDGIAEYGRQASHPEETALADRLKNDWVDYLKIRDDVLASILEGSTGEAVNLDLHGGVPAFDRVRQDLGEAKRLYDLEASRREANLIASGRRASFRLVGILCLTFLLSIATVWVIQRSRMWSTIELARMEMEFVTSVSHELRTPLAVLSSAADNLADGLVEGKEATRKYGGILQHQSRNMRELVDQILIFASTEDGKRRYNLQSLEVAPLIGVIVADCARLIKDAGFAIDQRIDSDLPCAWGDRAGIAQCLRNLIGNAVKYGGSERRIVLRAYIESLHQSDQELRISVADRGIGIDSSELTHIFDPFYRSPRVQAAQIHGTGLGLSLAKRIAESMGGRLSVVSELAAGSTFTLHLQIAKGQETQKDATVSRPSPITIQ